MAAVPHIKVQRGVAIFGASASSLVVTLTDAVGSTASAFARVTAVHGGAADPDAGTTSNKNNQDCGAYALLTSTTQVTITLPTGKTAEDRRVYWEVWEYTGPSGGKYEFVVKEHTIATISATATSKTQTSNLSGTKANMVPVHCGQTNDSQATQSLGNHLAALDLTGASPNINVIARRGGNGAALNVAYAVVEFTGSGWTVVQLYNQPLTSAALGADVSIAISSITDWTKTMILSCGHQLPGTAGTNADTTMTLRPGADATHIKARLNANHSNPGGNIHVFSCAMVYTDKIIMQRLDSITGSGTDLTGGGAAPQTVDETITDVRDTAHCIAHAWVDNDSTATSYPSGQWIYTLQSTTAVRLFRARTVGGGEFALEVADLNDVGYFTQSITATVSVSPSVKFQVNTFLSKGITIAPDLGFDVSFHMSRSVSIGKTLTFLVAAPAMSKGVTVTPTLALQQLSSSVAIRATRVTAEWISRRGSQRVRPLS